MKRKLLILVGLCLTIMSYSQKSISLQEAIDYAVQNNKTLQAKKLDIASSDQDIKNVLSSALPQINAGIDYQYYFNVPSQPVADFITPSVYGVLFAENVIPERDLGPPMVNTISFFQPHNLTGKIDANMLVYDGSYRYGVKAAKLYKDLTIRQIEATEYDIKSNVTKAYLNVLISKENIKILEDNIKVLRKSLSDTKAMYEAGFMESLDVDRLQLSYDKLLTQRDNITNLVELSKNLLKFQMGMPMTEDITLSDELSQMVGEINADEALLVETNYNNRPEYAVIEMGEQLNEIDYLRNKAAYLPSVRAFVSGQASLQRSNLFDNNEADWIPVSLAGLAINIPIYDGGMKKSNIAKAKINAERISIQKEEFKSAVDMQVQNAKIGLLVASQSLENAQKTLDITESIYEKVNIKFTEGVGSSVELTQAEASLYEAQASYINALYDLISAKSDLEIALGNI